VVANFVASKFLRKTGGHGKSKIKYTNLIVKMDRLPDPLTGALIIKIHNSGDTKNPPSLICDDRHTLSINYSIPETSIDSLDYKLKFTWLYVSLERDL
jgi:hypothetical protein